MTLSSMILKTKKRLYEDSFSTSVYLLGFLGLGHVLTASIRTMSLTWSYGVVATTVPVMDVSDHLGKDYATYEDKDSVYTIRAQTPMLILGDDALYFGSTKAFTENFFQIHDKVRIPHIDGSPQVTTLIKQLYAWQRERKLLQGIEKHPVALLLPGEQWPMAVIIQIMSAIKQTNTYQEVILASMLE
ncbi:MAG: hypothetical protein OXT67_02055 [Zetaproteobacteria bacterium]|nr:hypothetical protein [Zetaproteobacteria bacterium]